MYDYGSRSSTSHFNLIHKSPQRFCNLFTVHTISVFMMSMSHKTNKQLSISCSVEHLYCLTIAGKG